MVGNTDMARAYALIAAGGGRAVASGDTAEQLQAIAPGQPSASSRRAVLLMRPPSEGDCASDAGTAGGGIQPD